MAYRESVLAVLFGLAGAAGLILALDGSIERRIESPFARGRVDDAPVTATAAAPEAAKPVSPAEPAVDELDGPLSPSQATPLKLNATATARDPRHLMIEVALSNTKDDVAQGQLWAVATVKRADGATRRIASHGRLTYKARKVTFKLLELAYEGKADGKFVSYEVYVQDAKTNQVTIFTPARKQPQS